MRRSSRNMRFAVVALALGLVGAACGDDDEEPDASSPNTGSDEGEAPSDPGDDEEEWVLRVALAQEVPLTPDGPPNPDNRTAIYGNVNEPLIDFADDGSLVGRLATDWEFVDDTTIRFNLREGVTFHNGEPFNADAVVFSANRVRDPELAPGLAGSLRDIASVEVVDEYTVDLKLSRPFPEVETRLPTLLMMPPEHTASSATALLDEPVGTGPYMAESRSAEELVLVKNPDYWDGESEGPDRVEISFRPDPASRVAALAAGEIDIARELPVDLAEQVDSVITSPPNIKNSLILNPYREPTNDPRVRAAIIAAIDSEGIREAIFPDPYSEPGGCQIGHAGTFGYTEGLPDQEYDPDLARELLAEAGAEGVTLTFQHNPQIAAGMDEAVQIIVSQLREVGFEVDLQVLDPQTYIDTMVQGDIYTRGHVVVSNFRQEGSVARAYDVYLQPLGQATVDGFPHEEYPDFATTLAESLLVQDRDERAEAFAEINEIVCESDAYVFLWAPDEINGVADGISYPPRTDTGIRFVDVVRD